MLYDLRGACMCVCTIYHLDKRREECVIVQSDSESAIVPVWYLSF